MNLVDDKWTKRTIVVNILVVIGIWICIFTPYRTLQVLQTSINGQLGIYSISLHYGCKLITCFFGSLIVKKLTPKGTILMSSLCVMTYTLANFYPEWYTLIPAGILVGLCQGPLWVCHGIYGTFLSIEYARISGQSIDHSLSRINGFLASAVPFSIMFGSMLSSLILNKVTIYDDDIEPINVVESTSVILELANTTAAFEESTIALASTQNIENMHHFGILNKQCGQQYCPSYNLTTDSQTSLPDMRVFYILVAVLGCINILGILFTLVGLKNIPNIHFQSADVQDGANCYITKMFNWRLLLLTPAFIYVFLYIIYFIGTFPRAYITCIIGVDMIGYITMLKGITDFSTSIMIGLIGHFCHRNIWLLIGYLIAVTTVIFLFVFDLFTLSYNEVLVFLFVLSAMAGCVTSINISQSAAFVGAVFKDYKSEAFSFLHIVSSLSQGLGFYSNIYLCASYELYIICGVTILSAFSFATFWMCSKNEKSFANEKEGTFVNKQDDTTRL